MGLAQWAQQKPLGGLRLPQRLAVWRRNDFPFFNLFYRIFHRYRHDTRTLFTNPGDKFGQETATKKRPYAIVDQNHGRIIPRASQQPQSYRILSFVAAGHNSDNLGETETLDNLGATRVYLTRGSDQNNMIDEVMPLKEVNGVGQHRSPIEQEILLVDRTPHASAKTGGRDDDTYTHSLGLGS